MLLLLLDKFNTLPNVPEKTNFWFVRTMSGDFFQDYRANGFIAFGHNEIPYKTIKEAHDKFPGEDIKEKSKKIKYLGGLIKNIAGINRHNYWANQALKFCFDIKKGDYVLIPSYSSGKLAVGKVLESEVFIQPDKNDVEKPCNFYKRKKVQWLSVFNKWTATSELYPLLTSRHAITEAKNYSNTILKCAYDIYRRNDELHAIFHVRTTERISILDFGFYFDIAKLINEYFAEQNEHADIRSISIKSCVNSPGIFEFLSQNMNVLWIFSVFIILITGGDIEVTGVKIKAPGALKSIADFLHKRQHTKMIRDARMKMKKMDLKGPKEIEEVLKEYLKDDTSGKEE
jgi:restriction system protein